jgi:3,4-dihydroxy 2-butanone 4-phosphate synthase/GTP cyclohydrolase II
MIGHQMLTGSLAAVGKAGRGVVLYMQPANADETLLRCLTAKAGEALPMSFRDYGIGAQILVDLGVREIELLTNNPRKLVGLEAYGLKITKRIPIHVKPNRYNRRYLATKRDKLGHLLDLKLGET